jgi:hypothetical protein
MKARLLVTVTAVAFTAGTVFVAAQGTQPQPGGSPGAQGQGQPGAEPKGTTPKTGTLVILTGLRANEDAV